MAMTEMEIKHKDLLALCQSENAVRSTRDWCWRIAAVLRLRRMERGSVADFVEHTKLSEDIVTRMERGTEYATNESMRELTVFIQKLDFNDLPEMIGEANTFIEEDIAKLESNAKQFTKSAKRFLKNGKNRRP